MQKDIRLIGLDLDFTTLNAKKEITPRVAAAIENAIKAGIIVLPATGRALEGVSPAFLQIPGVRYALCANGAKVYDLAEDKILLENCFSRPVILEILEALHQLNAIPAVFIEGKVYSGPFDYTQLSASYNEQNIQYLRDSRAKVVDLRRFVADSPAPVEKISMLFYSMEDRAKTKEVLGRRGDCELTSSVPGNLEVNAAGVNKGAALLQLGCHLGIGRQQVMAVGDGNNDLEMLRAVGYAVAMANAAAPVKDVADWVTTSYEEDGVAVAIEGVMPVVR